MNLERKKVVITGGAGYIGSVLTNMLLKENYTVRVIDCLRNGGHALVSFFSKQNFEFIKGDLRDLVCVKKSLEDIDSVVHLAAIVGDPACKKNPLLAEEVNWQASKNLFELSKERGVKKFIFASTCSNYGKIPDSRRFINEEGVLIPVSLYAKLKVRCEEYFLRSEPDSMATTSLRFATAYGVSSRMRFDLTVNEFVKDATLRNKLIVFGEQFWRPYCHVEDISRACIKVLKADKKIIDHQVFNVGATEENYQKKTIVEMIRKRIPDLNVEYVHNDEDPRDYKVDFDKIKKTLSFRITKNISEGIDEVLRLMRSQVIGDPDDSRYKNY